MHALNNIGANEGFLSLVNFLDHKSALESCWVSSYMEWPQPSRSAHSTNILYISTVVTVLKVRML